MNKFQVGSYGKTAYANITAHKCKHFIIGFGEVVGYILETDKSNIHKADSRVGRICPWLHLEVDGILD